MSPEPFSYLLFVIASIFFEIFDVFIGQRKLRLLLCPLESFSSWDVSQFKLQLLQHFEKENCQCCVKELSTWNTLLLLGQHQCLPLLGNWHWLNLDLDYEKVTQEDCDQINLFNYLRWNEFQKKIIWYEKIYDHNHDFHFSAVKTLRSLRPMLFWRKYERDRKQAAVQCSKMFPPPQPALFLTNVTNEAPLSWNSPISSCAQMGPLSTPCTTRHEYQI